MESASIFYHEGFFLVSSLESCLKIARYASASNKIYAVNISGAFIAEYFKDALAQVLLYADFVFCNETEAEKFAEVNGFGTTDVAEIGKLIASLPKEGSRPRVSVITQGARATSVATATEQHSIPVPPVEKSLIVDTNGAGDCKVYPAFVGGFLAELAKDQPIDLCVQAGHYVSSEVIKRSGCCFPEHPTYHQ